MLIRVIPNAKQFHAFFREGVLVVKTRARAEDGKANAEIEEELGGMLGVKVTITKGHKSRLKQISLQGMTEEEAAEKIKGTD